MLIVCLFLVPLQFPKGVGRALAGGTRSVLATCVIVVVYFLLRVSERSPISLICSVLTRENERKEKEKRNHGTHVIVIAKSLQRSKEVVTF